MEDAPGVLAVEDGLGVTAVEDGFGVPAVVEKLGGGNGIGLMDHLPDCVGGSMAAVDVLPTAMTTASTAPVNPAATSGVRSIRDVSFRLAGNERVTS